ncbi:T9SS type A sorting domain-containing protein [candidate division KSB1 bacterium]|nr:T9SS type A sorting domain-containing protein [candidate division KSB1 bacterium]NIR72575.1 T9SS type A sorting domain-containing protein [candidate division KSB1 bacterium]NIS27327.1 T9SS type A sorting domain-containing protein [candidate division KSB1 bacterium]NIT74183.1 T9SS type A sorting domain-containing protein [candidate division KSB1 bacterium]NIU27409.1 T9SS type A sorting domain-containing protein [candidate division KSB1 bacterium]
MLNIGDPISRIGYGNLVEQTTDTLRILAIRIDFPEDANNLTTGNGTFDFSASGEIVIDPPPHDITYFEHQLLALSNYYKTVSTGKLILEGEVYPKDPQGSYTVSEEMSHYSPIDSEELLDRRLAELFQEAFQLADMTDDIDFSRFDCFMLFHAGVGGDFALDFDSTPQDIPSVFIDFQTLKGELGNNDPTYSGISVNEGQFFIRDGSILPETQSQEGFDIALLGTMAVMFGSQLGLPVLFNPDSGLPGIGVFGLMDQGSGNFFGLLPAEPCAWSKVFLGWETPIEVRNADSLPVAASQTVDRNKIYKIPINAREYFLVENRFRDSGGDNTAIARDANGVRIEFKWDRQGQRILAEEPPGVITQVSEYDFGLPIRFDSTGETVLPGPGLLIWHIDERIIEANFSANRVNANPSRRGVDLEEADGAQDIGQRYGLLDPGFGSENGITEDAWWGSHPVITRFLRPGEPVSFGPTTSPSSNANDGSLSHIIMTDFSEPDEVMTFSVREDISSPGFPQYVGVSGSVTNSPVISDLDDDGSQEIVWSSNNSTDVFVWNSDGSKFIPNQDVGERNKINGEADFLPLAVFANPPGSFAFSPAIARRNDGNVVVVVTDEAIVGYAPEDSDSNGRADELFAFQSGEIFTTSPIVIESSNQSRPFQIIVGTQSGKVVTVDSDGQGQVLVDLGTDRISGFAAFGNGTLAYSSQGGSVGALLLEDGSVLWQESSISGFSKPPAVADVDANGELNVILANDQGEFFVFDKDGNVMQGFPKTVSDNPPSELALADLNDDRLFEILFVADNEIMALNHVGNLVDNFPIRIDPQSAALGKLQTQTSPILADLNDDGSPEIIVGSALNTLVAFEVTGSFVSGFPLSVGGAINSTAAVSDLDADGDTELVAVSDDGFFYAWDLTNMFNPENVPWGSYLADARHTNAKLETQEPVPPSEQLLPANTAYNYPNPTEGNLTTIRYRLNFPAEVNIKIYDLAGELVDELAGTGFGQADNEVNWEVTNIESGVYLARVEAEGNGMKDVAIFKIAVVK